MTEQRPLTSLLQRRGNSKSQMMSSSAVFQSPQTVCSTDRKSEDNCFRSTKSQADYKKINFGQQSQQQQIELGFASSNLPSTFSASSVRRMPNLQQINSDIRWMNMSKITPKHILQDQERLYEELIHTKQELNQLKAQYHKINTQCWTLSQEVRKYELLQETEEIKASNLPSPIKKSKLNINSAPQLISIIPNLKSQVSELTVKLQQKEKELNEIKRNVKLTKICELEVELKTYVDETVRLKKLLQQSLILSKRSEQEEGAKSLEEQFIAQANQLSSLKAENSKFQSLMEELKAQLEEKDKSIKDAERQQQKEAKSKFIIKKLLVDKERELDKYQGGETIHQQTAKKNGEQLEGQFKIELKKKMLECNSLTLKVQEKERKISEMESKMKDLQGSYQDKLSQETREKEQLKQKSEKEHQELVELKEKYEQLFPIKRNKDRRMETLRGNNSETDTPVHRDSLSGYQTVSNLRRRNNDESQLHILSMELRAKLRQKKIVFSSLEDHLSPSNSISAATKSMSVDEIKVMLQNEPFGVENEEELSLICSHISENKDLQDEFATKAYKISEIKAFFHKFIGFYTIYTKEKFPEHYLEIQRYLNENEKIIHSYFEHDNIQHIERRGFEMFMKIHECSLDPVLYDILSQVSYENNHQTSHLNLEHLFSAFV